LFRHAIGSALVLLSVASVRADDYPNRPVTLIVPFAAGGPADFVGRVLTESMSKALGKQVVVENVGGAGGTTGATRTARAAPDGYTIMIYNQGFAAAPALYPKLAYDTLRDFKSIALVNRSPMVLIGRKDLPASDMKELAAYLKANGDKVRLAHAGIGGVAHLCALALMTALGVQPTLVPYRGGDPALKDILGGHVDLYCGLWDTIEPIKNGLAKGFGVFGEVRLASIPSVPTMGQVGYPTLSLYAWYSLFAPAKTPDLIIAKLNETLRKALSDPNIVQRFADSGSSIFPVEEQTPEFARTYFEREMQRLGDLIRSNNVTLE
jgi:tripartite-type tricarboxylate transporter receptor subunit TctC